MALALIGESGPKLRKSASMSRGISASHFLILEKPLKRFKTIIILVAAKRIRRVSGCNGDQVPTAPPPVSSRDKTNMDHLISASYVLSHHMNKVLQQKKYFFGQLDEMSLSPEHQKRKDCRHAQKTNWIRKISLISSVNIS